MEKLDGKDLFFIREKGFIYFNNVLDGFMLYNSKKNVTNFEEFKNYIKDLILKSEEAYFDFHFSRLNLEEQNNLLSKNFDYKNIINKFNLDKDKIFYSLKDLEDDILEFILEISFKEYLFSTFYFKNPYVTVWSNYNGEYISFF